MSQWLHQNWFSMLQSTGIIGSLLFTSVTFHINSKARRISNLIQITQHHRELLSQVYQRQDLSRVLDSDVNLQAKPITKEERWYILLLIQHLNASYWAMKDSVMIKPDGLQQDIHWFFSLPIPKVIWSDVKSFQDNRFVKYVDSIMETFRNPVKF